MTFLRTVFSRTENGIVVEKKGEVVAEPQETEVKNEISEAPKREQAGQKQDRKFFDKRNRKQNNREEVKSEEGKEEVKEEKVVEEVVKEKMKVTLYVQQNTLQQKMSTLWQPMEKVLYVCL